MSRRSLTFVAVLVASAVVFVAIVFSVAAENSTERTAGDRKLAQLNSCLARFRVAMYVGDDGRHRIFGDINRIQDIVDSPCGKKFGPRVRAEIDAFFAEEVDVRITHCLVRHGVAASTDSAMGPGISIKSGATKHKLNLCFQETYDWYEIPPDKRPAEDHTGPQD